MGFKVTVALKVSHLSVVQALTGTAIIADIGFSLKAGEIIALVGESGSGKSTAGLAILGHCRPGLIIQPGSTVEIDGTSVLEANEQRLRELRGSQVAYVPQDPSTALNPALRVRTQLKECIGSESSSNSESLVELLRNVNLPPSEEFLNRFPHQMSGGQQQRVTIAMAFARNPRVVVMDEPTTGLDVSTQAQILRLVRQLCDSRGAAIIYITHDLAVVSQLASRVAVMYAGRIVEEGPTSSVLGSPAHPYTAALIGAVPNLGHGGMLSGIPGQAPDPASRPSGCSFHPRCGFCQQRCRESVPIESRLAPDHSVRCHFPLSARIDATSSPSREPRLWHLALLDVANLSAGYGTVKILQNVSFRVGKGECLAIVGQSGSGKTTLARSIAGIHDGYSGDISFNGVAVARGRKRSRSIRKDMQYVFQNPYASLNPRCTIGQSIAAALLTLEDVSREQVRLRTAEALAAVSLSESVATRYPRELSGGQRQRAAIARALVVRPKLLICDEVTSALDVSIQAVILSLIDKLKREFGLSVMFVTHNLVLIASIADKVIVLAGGKVIEYGEVGHVLGNPSSDYTRSLIADTPKFENEIAN
jgi:peptide/nickel transport system ATP-binding protein